MINRFLEALFFANSRHFRFWAVALIKPRPNRKLVAATKLLAYLRYKRKSILKTTTPEQLLIGISKCDVVVFAIKIVSNLRSLNLIDFNGTLSWWIFLDEAGRIARDFCIVFQMYCSSECIVSWLKGGGTGLSFSWYFAFATCEASSFLSFNGSTSNLYWICVASKPLSSVRIYRLTRACQVTWKDLSLWIFWDFWQLFRGLLWWQIDHLWFLAQIFGRFHRILRYSLIVCVALWIRLFERVTNWTSFVLRQF